MALYIILRKTFRQIQHIFQRTCFSVSTNLVACKNNSTRENMAYEDIFPYLGSYGPYQRRIHVLLCLPSILVAFHRLVGVFLLAEPSHRCLLQCDCETGSFNLPPEIVNMTLPWDSQNKDWSSCERLDTNFSEDYFAHGLPASDTRKCESWVYDNTTYTSSIVTEHNLVCDNKWLVPTGQSVFMLGDLLGSLVFGGLSDKFGRKKTFILALILQVLFGLILAFLDDIVSFLILRILTGMATAGIFNSSYVIGIELVGPDKRLLAGIAVEFFWCIGYVILTGLAYFFRDWKTLQIVTTIPGVIFLCYWWVIPESARWLMAEGRQEEAKTVLRNAAKANKRAIPEDVMNRIMKSDTLEQQNSLSILHILKHRNLCLRSLNIFFNWFAVCSVFYGLSLNTSNLGGNDYINFLLTGLAEVPSYIVLLLTLNRWGRVPVLGSTVLLASATMFIIAAIPEDMNWLIVTASMVGKFAVSCSFATNFTFTLELFPTVIRNAAVGAGATCARFGSLISPYINMLGIFWKPLPSIIFGIFLLIAGLTAFLLPETLNKDLPDSIDDGENLGSVNKSFHSSTPECNSTKNSKE